MKGGKAEPMMCNPPELKLLSSPPRVSSPRSRKEASGGVGLALLASLEKPGLRSFTRSDPIPIGAEDMEEFYTYVTSHRSDKTITTVYSDAKEEPRAYPPLGFLHACHLCHKKLDGRDIYMYRGEKGFCSEECRARQMMADEMKEHRSANILTSATASSPVFCAGVLAV